MEANNIHRIVIAGAGLMGTSIAQIFAKNSYHVTMYDIEQRFLDRSLDLIRLNTATMQKEGSSEEEISRIRDNIHFAAPLDQTCFSCADLVIECIVEDLDIKTVFWKAVSEIAPAEAILTTNTSGLSINEIAKAVCLPERFCGMHWFNPAHLIPLIEVIKGEHTSHETMETVYQIAEQLGKKPIYVSRDALGFIANRIQLAILRECIHIKEEGIGDFKDIDRCMKYGLGFRYACLGPFEVCDHGGLDTFYHIASYLYEDLASNKSPDGTLLQTLFDSAEYGVKSGKGFYDYSDGLDREAVDIRDQMYIEMAKRNITSISEPYEKKL